MILNFGINIIFTFIKELRPCNYYTVLMLDSLTVMVAAYPRVSY